VASHRFATLVRAFVVVGSGAQRRLFSFSGTRVACHSFDLASKDGQTLSMQWAKPTTGIVRDAAEQDGLVLFGGFAGQICCINTEREEDLTGVCAQRLSTLVYRAAVRESIASVQFALCHRSAISVTTDSAGLQIHDLRNRLALARG
jgi:hypothetical protein